MLGNGFCEGGVKKTQDNESFSKVTPLIWAIEGQNNESYRGGLDLKKKSSKIPLFEKFPTEVGGGGGFWRDWDGFPTLTSFEL